METISFRSRLGIFAAALVGLLVNATPGYGCDPCAVHNLMTIDEGEARTVSLGLSMQFTRYAELQVDGAHADNTAHQFLESYYTQLSAGYKLHERFGIQATLPFISRHYRRPTAHGSERDDETGLGDMSLLGRVVAYKKEASEQTLFVTFIGGLKMPTGDASPLGEEAVHEALPAAADNDSTRDYHGHGPLHHAGHTHEGGVRSAVHGHDIALGSGSFDGIFGTNIWGRYRRATLAASVQYLLRSEGSFDYRYGNDLLWSVSPGYYLILEDPHSVSLRLTASGETKGKDVVRGDKEHDTRIRTVFLGPELSVTFGNSFRGDIALDLPLEIDSSGTQLVADYRWRAALVYSF